MWKLSRYPDESLLGGQACYCLVCLPAGKLCCLYFQRLYWKHGQFSTNFHLNKAQRPHSPLRPFIHHFAPFNFVFCFFPLLLVSAAAKVIVVSEETERSMKVTWQPAPGNVLNYRVTYKPKLGGRQLAAKVPGGNTSTVLRRLTALTTYDITVLPVYRSGEGKAREGEGTTCMSVHQTRHLRVLLREIPVHSHAPPFFLVTPYKGPRNLQTSDPSRTSFRVTWDHAPGDVKGYKVQFHPVGEDIDLGELLVGPFDNTVVLEELRCVIRLFFFLQ